MLLQQRDISGSSYKGKPDHVRMTGNKFEMLDVHGRQTVQIEPAIRQVDAFVSQQFFSAITRLRDLNQDFLGR